MENKLRQLLCGSDRNRDSLRTNGEGELVRDLPFTPRGDDHCLRVFHGLTLAHPRYPFALRSSAFSRAAPAAPRIVLCDRTVNFQSRTLHLRRRPTAVVMPPPRSTSKRGCGRSAAVMYNTGCSGALGRRNRCGSARKSFQAAMISSGFAFCLSRIATDSV